jgi:2-keto-3-deoxy-6-phosphogluconate aldolase
MGWCTDLIDYSVREMFCLVPALRDQTQSREVEDVVVGAGTMSNRIDFDRAAEAGVRSAVSPGLTPDLAMGGPIPLLPGAATVMEIMMAREAGFDLLKFFPAVPAGGSTLCGPSQVRAKLEHRVNINMWI